MKKTYPVFCAFLFLFLMKTSAQVIPDSLRVDWSHAGFEGNIPEPSLVINVKEFGAYGDSIHNDYKAINKAISSCSSFRIIFFPAGNYLIKSPIFLPDSIVLKGEGASTQLIFDLSKAEGENNCITVSALQTGIYNGISCGYYKGSDSVRVADWAAKKFMVNSYAEIREQNGEGGSSSGYFNIGQIVKILSVNENSLKFSSALRIDYDTALQPEIRPLVMKTCVGLECFKITRLDRPKDGNSGQNIEFIYATNCWVKGIESNVCQSAHLRLTSCSHISVSGCFFHDAFTFNGGGQGYGAQCRRHTSDCKIENSIFGRLRHAMIQQSGANGNVYAYNYSFDPRSSTEVPKDKIGDISLHGDYAFANLFEGNIAQNIFVDDYWGASGPYNTFFRNRAELYGLEVMDDYHYPVKSDRQNIVGNEITNKKPGKGNYVLKGINHFTYSNNIRGNINPEKTEALTDSSYYLTCKPYFWDANIPWPSIGYPNILNKGTNPAKARYFSAENKTVCAEQAVTEKQLIIVANAR